MAKLKRSFGYKKAVVAYLRERQMINGKLFCALCNEPLSRNKTTIDHIIPLAKGGEERLENYQLVHRRCNELKGDNYGFTIDIVFPINFVSKLIVVHTPRRLTLHVQRRTFVL